MPSYWYALHVKPHKERSVNDLLSTKDVDDVFFPAVRVVPVNPRSARIRPYFPGYLFVKADIEQLGSSALTWLPGVHRLVTFGGEPSVVPENLISELRARVDEIEKIGGLQYDDMKPGDPVRIVEGPFAGYEAIFDMRLAGQDRIQVLLAFLSEHPQPIQLDTGMVEKDKRDRRKGGSR